MWRKIHGILRLRRLSRPFYIWDVLFYLRLFFWIHQVGHETCWCIWATRDFKFIFFFGLIFVYKFLVILRAIFIKFNVTYFALTRCNDLGRLGLISVFAGWISFLFFLSWTFLAIIRVFVCKDIPYKLTFSFGRHENRFILISVYMFLLHWVILDTLFISYYYII
jgi:hypothetical protein